MNEDHTEAPTATETEEATVWPEQHVELENGQVVEVRHMTAAESRRLGQHWRPIAERVRELLGHADDPETVSNTFHELLDEQADALAACVDACTDLDRETLDAMPPDDADYLAVTWLSVHLGFFVRRRAISRSIAAAITTAASNSESTSAS